MNLLYTKHALGATTTSRTHIFRSIKLLWERNWRWKFKWHLPEMEGFLIDSNWINRCAYVVHCLVYCASNSSFAFKLNVIRWHCNRSQQIGINANTTKMEIKLKGQKEKCKSIYLFSLSAAYFVVLVSVVVWLQVIFFLSVYRSPVPIGYWSMSPFSKLIFWYIFFSFAVNFFQCSLTMYFHRWQNLTDGPTIYVLTMHKQINEHTKQNSTETNPKQRKNTQWIIYLHKLMKLKLENDCVWGLAENKWNSSLNIYSAMLQKTDKSAKISIPISTNDRNEQTVFLSEEKKKNERNKKTIIIQ